MKENARCSSTKKLASVKKTPSGCSGFFAFGGVQKRRALRWGPPWCLGDDAGPTLFNIGDMRNGDTYELDAPITDWAKVYIYGSSAPGGAVDIYGSPNDIMEKAPSDLSESDLAGYTHEVQEWYIYQHEEDLLTEIGKIEVDIEVKNNKCDISLDGQFDGRDVAEFQNGCNAGTATWLCDLSEDGMFDGRDVQQYVKDCKRS